MESLLRWSIENSTPGDGTVNRPQQPLDPGIIDHILGKPDSVLMKESLAVAVDDQRGVDERADALEEFETVRGFSMEPAFVLLIMGVHTVDPEYR